MHSYNKLDDCDTRPLFKVPIFKIYSDTAKNGDESINRKFSLEDLKEVPEDDLQSKVFVSSSSPDSLNLNDELVLETKFMRVKRQTIMHN